MMNSIVEAGEKWLKSGAALKVGKAILSSRAGIVGVGVGAAAGLGYLAYSYLTREKKNDIVEIEDISNNNPEVEGNKIVI